MAVNRDMEPSAPAARTEVCQRDEDGSVPGASDEIEKAAESDEDNFDDLLEVDASLELDSLEVLESKIAF